MERRIENLESTVYGNGGDGLKITVAELKVEFQNLETVVKDIVEDRKFDRRMAKQQLYATIGGVFLIICTVVVAAILSGAGA